MNMNSVKNYHRISRIINRLFSSATVLLVLTCLFGAMLFGVTSGALLLGDVHPWMPRAAELILLMYVVCGVSTMILVLMIELAKLVRRLCEEESKFRRHLLKERKAEQKQNRRVERKSARARAQMQRYS